MNSQTSDHLATVLAFLRNRAEEGFWGTVSLKFKDGALVHVTTEESRLPEQLHLTPKDRNPHESNPPQQSR